MSSSLSGLVSKAGLGGITSYWLLVADCRVWGHVAERGHEWRECAAELVAPILILTLRCAGHDPNGALKTAEMSTRGDWVKRLWQSDGDGDCVHDRQSGSTIDC